MKNTADSQQDADRFAVIRDYEPIRIERELLAQVFGIVSERPAVAKGRLDQSSASTPLNDSQVADGVRSLRCIAPKNAASREALEPAA